MKQLLSIALTTLPLIACTTETVETLAPSAGTDAVSTTDPHEPAPTTLVDTIGPEGGTLEAPGIRLEIPAGALEDDVRITITKTDASAPPQHQGLTPVYTFFPEGLTLKKAGRVLFTDVPEDALAPVIGWAESADSDVYEGLKTTQANGVLSASISTLTKTFVALTECMTVDGDASAAICRPTPAPATLNSGRWINGFALTGFEYWQWKKPDPYDGGNEVAWGYNGDGQPQTGVVPTDASRACMAESFRTLEAILESAPPEELEELRTQHGVKQFWFWNNDMTDAAPSVTVPKNYSELWLFQGNRGDGGLIKWISSTERDGTCKLPTREDLVLFAKGCLTTFPLNNGAGRCGSGK